MQYKVAEKITEFAGSMLFVYLHTIWFVLWFVFKLDINLLTLIVSLEAIYLSTFIMIAQNRQEQRVEELAAEVQDEAFDEDIDEIQEDVDDIQEDVDEIQEDVDDIQKQVVAMRKEMAELKQLLRQNLGK